MYTAAALIFSCDYIFWFMLLLPKVKQLIAMMYYEHKNNIWLFLRGYVSDFMLAKHSNVFRNTLLTSHYYICKHRATAC